MYVIAAHTIQNLLNHGRKIS